MIYMDSHGIRFTLNDFSAPCPLCELGEKKKNNAGRTESPKFATPKWPDLAWLGPVMVGAWALWKFNVWNAMENHIFLKFSRSSCLSSINEPWWAMIQTYVE